MEAVPETVGAPGRPGQTDTEQRVAASVRDGYLNLLPASFFFSVITTAAVVAVFWRHVDSDYLAVWACIVSVTTAMGSMAVRAASFERFSLTVVIFEVALNTCWAALPWFAMPTSSDWQVYQGMVLIGLLMSTLGNATVSRASHIAATVPIAVIGALAFAVKGVGAAPWLWAGFAVTLPFTLSAGSVLGRMQKDLFVSSIENEDLADRLSEEGRQLKTLNDQLEAANTDLDAQARIDGLTRLYNRTGFTALLDEAVAERPGTIIVCYLDLDRFKRINDTFGHGFGDYVLQMAALRISRVLKSDEVLARQGGDELTLLGHANARGDVEDLARRIMSVFDDPFQIEGRRLDVSVSVGLVWVPEATSAADLTRFADTALYKAKENGRGRYEIFDDAMRAELTIRSVLEADLGMALERSEMVAYLQPIVDISTGKIASAEALARWEHSTGLRAAGEFIDTARDLGILERINQAVTAHAIAFQRLMYTNERPPCPIAVNTSPVHFEATLDQIIAEEAIDPLAVEITEDGIFADMDNARKLLERARRADIPVLLDDFGVGFSSLAIATELPVDGFKIDRGFVASLEGNPSAVAAVEAILQLANRMDLRVVAEGVETPAQLELLRGLGVQFAQGYLFSPAVPTQVFGEWIISDHTFDVFRSRTVV